MKIVSSTLILFAFLFCLKINAQSNKTAGGQISTQEEYFTTLDFVDKGDNTFLFKAISPELRQKAGAPEAFWTYYWEFGDGQYSFEESPEHTYTASGEMDARLFVTNNYSDGKPPPTKRPSKPKPKPKPKTLTASVNPTIIDNKSIKLQTNHNPAPEEEMALIFTYKNQSNQVADGKLYLFFNEKKYPSPHFELLESRTHFGESEVNADQLLGMMEEGFQQPEDYWVSTNNKVVRILGNKDIAIKSFEQNTLAKAVLEGANETYRDKAAWSFSNLKPGEERNLFTTMFTTPEMLKDTSAMIIIKGIFVSDDGLIFDDYDLELEIVASHDPNKIAVSDNRINFRNIRKTNLKYKVKFQNNGEGPASTVNVEVNIPEGMSIEKVKLMDYYPFCPICPTSEVEYSCLDTIVNKGGLARGARINFIFRNIYLPGTKQEGVEHRDSTKGHIRYEILTTKKMKKQGFGSQASIVFDKNPPVITNSTSTRFKKGISPGFKFGLNHFPDDNDLNHYFVGVVYSAYKPHGWYWQPEALLSFSSGETSGTFRSDSAFCASCTNQLMFEVDTFSVNITTEKNRIFRMDLIPVQIRKDLNDFISVGFGAIATFDLLSQKTTSGEKQLYAIPFSFPGGPPPMPTFLYESSFTPEVKTRDWVTNFDGGVFVDLFVGKVRAGPGVGLRSVYRFSEKPKNYFQLYASWKF